MDSMVNLSSVMTLNSTITEVKVAYAVFDSVMAVATVIGNLLVIVAFTKEPNLKTVTNYFIFSLAVTDLLVGAVGMPIYIYSMLTDLPAHFEFCLIINTWILTLCTISIFHLLALSYDRYTVIVTLTRITQSKKEKRARLLIGAAWLLGTIVGCLPLMGWNNGPPEEPRCIFVEIIDFSYLVFLYYFTIITPTVFMIFFYVGICRKVHQHNQTGLHNKGMINKQKMKYFVRQRKIVFSLVLVIVSFFVCWYPLYTLNAVSYYCPDCTIHAVWFYITIVLSHFSSAINPLIYAYTMPGFRDAFQRVLSCQKPLPRRLSMGPNGSNTMLTNLNVNSTNTTLTVAKEGSNLLPRRKSSTNNFKWFLPDDNSDCDRRGSNCSSIFGSANNVLRSY